MVVWLDRLLEKGMLNKLLTRENYVEEDVTHSLFNVLWARSLLAPLKLDKQSRALEFVQPSFQRNFLAVDRAQVPVEIN